MGKMGETIRVLLADDQPVARAGLHAILEQAPDIQIVGVAHDGIEAQRLTAELRPDVLMLDLVMPGPQPWEIEKWVRTHYPETVTVVFTAHDRDMYLAKMIGAGAAGFLTKNKDGERLVEMVRCAARGEAQITGGQLARAFRWQEEVGQKWESLTRQERRVLRLLIEGCDNEAIAEALHVTMRTVEYHVTNVLSKLGVGSRLEAAAWVHEHLPDDLWKSAG